MENRRLHPVSGDSRIQILDILRGFALLGILMVNVHWFGTPVTVMISSLEHWTGPASDAVNFFIKFLFEGKFYVLFSMLFGYGFYLFLTRKKTVGKSVVATYSMRLFILLIFGLLHVILLWPGDILVYYAVLGFVLILFRNVSPGKLINWAIGFLLIPSFFVGFGVLFMSMPEAAEAIEQGMEETNKYMKSLYNKALAVYPSGSFREMIDMRIQEYKLLLNGILFFQVNIMGMFLVGVYAAKKQLLENLDTNISFFKKLMVWGYAIGIPANLFFAWSAIHYDTTSLSINTLLVTFANAFGNPALSLAYVSTLVVLFNEGRLLVVSQLLAPVGRMALTNYLVHSIAGIFVFHAYGLGLFGKIPPWQLILPAVAFYLLQVWLSKIWLKKYRFGPFEWIWRTLTYFEIQKIRK